jgi:2,4-dienoyl-CoA reductase-like NADH-dependent reductase (Old Yellow Enzyme family)
MTVNDIKMLREKFVKAAQRSVEAGFQTIELHMLTVIWFINSCHHFLTRGSIIMAEFGKQDRFAIEIAREVRNNIPRDIPLFVRLSCTDWVENGWMLSKPFIYQRH